MEMHEGKRQEITKAALKRFSHFGIGKTTLSEIADDAGISKANIYYYFADKEAIIGSVIEELLMAFNEIVKRKIDEIDTITGGFISYLETRKEFLDKYYMLYSSDLNEILPHTKRFKEHLEMIKQSEAQLIQNLFEQGINSQEFVTIDVKKTSQLYLESIKGLDCMYQQCPYKDVGDKSFINVMYQKQVDLTKIFLNGLSIHNAKNNYL